MLLYALTALLLNGPIDQTDGQAALSQIKSLLALFDVPGPYIFKSYQSSGVPGGHFCVLKVLDGERMMCTAESQPSSTHFSLLFRGKFTGPTQNLTTGSPVKELPSKPLTDERLRNIVGHWTAKLLGRNQAKLVRFDATSDGVGTASYLILLNGKPPLNGSSGLTFTFSVPGGRFLSLTGNQDVPPADPRPIRLKTANMAIKQFESIYRTGIWPHEQDFLSNPRLGMVSTGPMVKHGKMVLPFGRSLKVPRVSNSFLGYFVLPGRHASVWGWKLYYESPGLGDGSGRGAMSVSIDAFSGKVIVQPQPEVTL